jgi:2-oxoglutarate dehydrogenase E1 component
VDPNVFATANAGFAQSLYEDYLRDPASVGPEWRQLFDSGVVGEKPATQNGAHAPTAAPAAEQPARPARPDHLEIKGPALRLVQNMNESLTVPTATTFRELPVARLEAER